MPSLVTVFLSLPLNNLPYSRRRKKASSVSPETKRKVYIKGSAGSKVVERKKPQSPARVAPTSSTSGTAGKEVFGLYYTPPGGFCEECNER